MSIASFRRLSMGTLPSFHSIHSMPSRLTTYGEKCKNVFGTQYQTTITNKIGYYSNNGELFISESLEHKISLPRNVDDDLLKRIAKTFKGSVELYYCDKITSAGVQQLLDSEGISKVTVMGCYNLKDELDANGKDLSIHNVPGYEGGC